MSVPPDPRPVPPEPHEPATTPAPPPEPTPPPEPLRLRLRTLTDLIAAVPYLIGFHPADSLVVIGFAGRAVVFAARIDLPGHGGGTVSTTAGYAVSLLERQTVHEAVLIGYGQPGDAEPLMARCRVVMARAGMVLHDALWITGDRYRSLLCDVPECCPPDGMPFEVSSSEVAAAATLAGRVALPDRAAVESLIAPVGGAERRAIALATARAEATLHLEFEASDLAAARRRLIRQGTQLLDSAVRRYPTGGRLDHHEVATLSVLLLLEAYTDVAWRRVINDAGYRQVAMWSDLLRRVQPDLSAPVATLLGYAAWRNGQGALARVATQRALTISPRYEPATLMYEILLTGVGPGVHSAVLAAGMTPYDDSDHPGAL
ncbi:MAG: DUF4192 domain-containing protein [Micromonosporaceae bacterium]